MPNLVSRSQAGEVSCAAARQPSGRRRRSAGSRSARRPYEGWIPAPCYLLAPSAIRLARWSPLVVQDCAQIPVNWFLGSLTG